MKALVSFSKSKVVLFSSLVFTAILAGSPAIASAHGGTPAAVDLSVLSPTVPAGGLVQMQVFITEPKPILKGKQGVRSGTKAAIAEAAASPLGPVRDAALFSSGGDVS